MKHGTMNAIFQANMQLLLVNMVATQSLLMTAYL